MGEANFYYFICLNPARSVYTDIKSFESVMMEELVVQLTKALMLHAVDLSAITNSQVMIVIETPTGDRFWSANGKLRNEFVQTGRLSNREWGMKEVNADADKDAPALVESPAPAAPASAPKHDPSQAPAPTFGANAAAAAHPPSSAPSMSFAQRNQFFQQQQQQLSLPPPPQQQLSLPPPPQQQQQQQQQVPEQAQPDQKRPFGAYDSMEMEAKRLRPDQPGTFGGGMSANTPASSSGRPFNAGGGGGGPTPSSMSMTPQFPLSSLSANQPPPASMT